MGCITKAELLEWIRGVSQGLLGFIRQQVARRLVLTPMSCLQWRDFGTAAVEQNAGFRFLAHLFAFANRSFEAAFATSGFQQRCVTIMDVYFYHLLAALMNPPVPDWAAQFLLHCRSSVCLANWDHGPCASCGSPSIFYALHCGHNVTERLPNYQNGSLCNVVPSDDFTHVSNLESNFPIELVLLVLTAVLFCSIFIVVLIRVGRSASKEKADVKMLQSCFDAWTYCSWTLEAPPDSLDQKFAACLGFDASEGFCLFDMLCEEDRSRLRAVLGKLKLSNKVPSKINVTLWHANLRGPGSASPDVVELTLLPVSSKLVLLGVYRSADQSCVPPPEHIGLRDVSVLATADTRGTENASPGGRRVGTASSRSSCLSEAGDLVSGPSDASTRHSASALDTGGQITGECSTMQTATFNRHLPMAL